jgi:PAS domain S-box-containing protein
VVTPALTEHESERLETLKQYKTLEAEAEAEAEQIFDDLTQLASHICDTPIALISLLDENRQWFKSKVGIDAVDTPREISFCSHTIHQNDLFEINDTLKDNRFLGDPLVTGNLKIRFYAGMPLTTARGQNLGTLCVLDQKPKQLNTAQRAAMARLARQVVSQIEKRDALEKVLHLNQQLIKKSDFTQGITDSVPVMLGYWNKDLICEFANQGYSRWFGKSPVQIIGRSMRELVCEQLFNNNLVHVQQALAGHEQSFERELEQLDGTKASTLIRYIPHKVESGEIIGFYVFIQDISLSKQAEKDIQFTAQVFEHMTDGCIIANTHHKIVNINQAFTDLTGFVAEEVIGKLPYFIESKTLETNTFAQAFTATVTEQSQNKARILHKDNRYIDCMMTVDSVFDENGNIANYIVSFIDQTQSNNAQLKLEYLTDMLERTGNIAKVGGWELDIATNQFNYSASLYKILESNPFVKIRLEDASIYLTPEVQAQLLSAKDLCLKLGTAWSLEIPATTAHGKHIWLQSTGERVTNHGIPIKLIGTFQDITERKIVEADRIAAEHAYRDTLIREVHHRIKNNLQGVTGILRNLSEHDEMLADPVNQVISQIQTIAVIHGLQGRKVSERVELNELVSAITVSIRSIWRKPITLAIYPQHTSGYIEEIEAVPIALILNELVTNAAKHHRGDGPIRIQLNYDAASTDTLVEILNTGVAEQTNQDDKISGMGLQFARSLMPKRGASLALEQMQDEIKTTLKLSANVVNLENY